MADYYRQLIRKNLPFLCENSGSLKQVTTKLFSRGVITLQEKQKIEKAGTECEGFMELYMRMFQKVDENTYHHLLNSLEDTGNDHIINTLKKPLNASGSTLSAETSMRTSPNQCQNIEKSSNKQNRIYFMVSDPTESFVGRDSFLAELEKSLNQNPSEKRFLSRTKVISGFGGIGKTELARKYVLKYKGDFCHLVWVDASTQSSAAESFNLLAQRLHIQDQEKGNKFLLDAVYSVLLQEKCLLVFDNAELRENGIYTADGIDRFLLESLPPDLEIPFIIITSRNKPLNDDKIICMDSLSEGESTIYMRANLKKEVDAGVDDAEKLYKVCGGIPLALQNALALINAESKLNEYDISKFEQEYNQCKLKFLQYQTAECTKPLIVILDVTIHKIRARDHGILAINILNCLSFLEPATIPKKLISDILYSREPRENLRDAIGLLNEYSLIDDNKSHYSIHRMIQDVNIERQSLEGQTLEGQFSVQSVISQIVGELQGICDRDLAKITGDANILKNIRHIVEVHLRKHSSIPCVQHFCDWFAHNLALNNNY